MTNHKWIDFAGYLNGCIHQLDHHDCPFKQYTLLDQYQRLEYLLAVSDTQASNMMKSCLKHQEECKPILIQKQESR